MRSKLQRKFSTSEKIVDDCSRYSEMYEYLKCRTTSSILRFTLKKMWCKIKNIAKRNPRGVK